MKRAATALRTNTSNDHVALYTLATDAKIHYLHYALYSTNNAYIIAQREHLNIISVARCSAGTLVSRDIRFIQIFMGVLRKRRQTYVAADKADFRKIQSTH